MARAPEDVQGRWERAKESFLALEESYLRERLGPGGYRASLEDDVAAVGDSLSATVDLYRQAAAAQREQMRELFRTAYRLRPVLLRQAVAPALVGGTGDGLGQRLRTALAALSLEDNQTDYRDTLCTLGDLCVKARRGGVDFQALLAEAASLSGTGPFPGGASMRDFLLGFERSAFFSESVAPRLRQP